MKMKSFVAIWLALWLTILAWSFVMGDWSKPNTIDFGPAGTTVQDGIYYNDQNIDDAYIHLNTLKEGNYDSTPPAAPNTGETYVDSDDYIERIYDGTNWELFSMGAGAVANPGAFTAKNDEYIDYVVESAAYMGQPYMIWDGKTKTVAATITTATAVSGGAGDYFLYLTPTAGDSTFTLDWRSAADQAGMLLAGWLYWDGSEIENDSIGAVWNTVRQDISVTMNLTSNQIVNSNSYADISEVPVINIVCGPNSVLDITAVYGNSSMKAASGSYGQFGVQVDSDDYSMAILLGEDAGTYYDRPPSAGHLSGISCSLGAHTVTARMRSEGGSAYLRLYGNDQKSSGYMRVTERRR